MTITRTLLVSLAALIFAVSARADDADKPVVKRPPRPTRQSNFPARKPAPPKKAVKAPPKRPARPTRQITKGSSTKSLGAPKAGTAGPQTATSKSSAQGGAAIKCRGELGALRQAENDLRRIINQGCTGDPKPFSSTLGRAYGARNAYLKCDPDNTANTSPPDTSLRNCNEDEVIHGGVL